MCPVRPAGDAGQMNIKRHTVLFPAAVALAAATLVAACGSSGTLSSAKPATTKSAQQVSAPTVKVTQREDSNWAGWAATPESTSSRSGRPPTAPPTDRPSTPHGTNSSRPPTVAVSMTVEPGDQFSARVAVSGQTVTLSISDLTQNTTVSRKLHMSGPTVSSAEW